MSEVMVCRTSLRKNSPPPELAGGEHETPSTHRRPDYSSAGCFSVEPASASPGTKDEPHAFTSEDRSDAWITFRIPNDLATQFAEEPSLLGCEFVIVAFRSAKVARAQPSCNATFGAKGDDGPIPEV